MANPRNTIDFTDIGLLTATFHIDAAAITYSATEENGSAAVGFACTLSADQTITLAGDGEGVLGKVLLVEADNKATVAVKGFMRLPGGDGATLTRMKSIVGDLGAAAAEGYVREVATATAAELGVCRGVIIDDDATSPWILL